MAEDSSVPALPDLPLTHIHEVAMAIQEFIRTQLPTLERLVRAEVCLIIAESPEALENARRAITSNQENVQAQVRAVTGDHHKAVILERYENPSAPEKRTVTAIYVHIRRFIMSVVIDALEPFMRDRTTTRSNIERVCQDVLSPDLEEILANLQFSSETGISGEEIVEVERRIATDYLHASKMYAIQMQALVAGEK